MTQSSGVKPLRTPSNFFDGIEASPMVSNQTFRLGTTSTNSPTRAKAPRISTVRKAVPSTFTAAPQRRFDDITGDSVSLSKVFSSVSETPTSSAAKTAPGASSAAGAAPQKGPKLSRLAQKALETRSSQSALNTTGSIAERAPPNGKRAAPTALVEASSKRQKIVFSRAADQQLKQAEPKPSAAVPKPMNIDARWMEKQETMMTQWLNYIVAPSTSKSIFPDANRMSIHSYCFF
jgi:hypothetical protein